MKIAAFLLFTFQCFGFLAQEKDPFLSEKGVYSKARWTIRDTSLINDIADESVRIGFAQSQRAELLARTAIQLSGKIEFAPNKVEANIAMSKAKIYLNDYDSAMHYALVAEKIAVQKSLKTLQVRCLELRGNVYSYQEKYEDATKCYFEAIKKGGKIGEKETVRGYASLGYVFNKLGNTQRSKEYCEKAYKLGKKHADTSVVVSALNLLGLAAKNEGNNDEALERYEEGLKLSKESKNIERESQILYNIANIYFDKNNYEKGFEYFNESIEISKSNSSYTNIGISFHSLAYTHFQLGQVRESMRVADSALHYALLSGNYELILETYAMKGEISYALGDLDDAFAYLSYAYAYKDSMNLSQLNDAALTAENAYEEEKKKIEDSLTRVQQKLEIENQEKINNQKLQSRETLIWIFAIVLILVIIGIYFLIKNNRLIKTQNALVNSQKEEIQLQHSEITDSINYAKRIQDAMINKQSEWDKIGSKNYIFFRPKDVVSGDFYWAHNIGEVSIWAVADCTGHGVPGAFMSMLGFGFLNEIVIEGGITDPAEILNRLRSKIISALGEKGENQARDGMDVSICVWDKSTKELQYAGANNPLWIIRHNSTEKPENIKRVTTLENSALELLEIEPDKMPVGFYTAINKNFSNKSIQLHNGDVIIQLTDGFADQFGGELGKKLKYAPLKRSLIEVQSLQFENQHEAVATIFDNWKLTHEQVDDVCLVAVKVG